MRFLRRFLLGFILMLLLLGGLWTVLFRVQLGKPTELGRLLHEIVRYRQDSAAAAPGPCLILAGGSNVSYSYRALVVSDQLGLPVVNFGLHAGLTLDYSLHLIAESARPGDTVVLLLEYQHYGYDGRTRAVLADYVCGYDPAYFESLPLPEQARFIYAFNFWGLTEPSLSLVQRALHRSRPVREVRRGADIPYFDRHGDVLHTERANRREGDFRNVLADRPAPLEFDGREASWAILDRFLARMEERGVRVLHGWPVTRSFDFYATDVARDGFSHIESYFAARGVPTLGRPEDFLFPAEDFFDTAYHLVAERRQTPSLRLAEALAREGLGR
jgi:hypothetical protein